MSSRDLVAGAALLCAAATASAQTAAAPTAPVVLELFTSLGCSSCPPAETFLSRIGSDPEVGRLVIPLAYHVDYWDRLGWKDPFSDAGWSERQRIYERALKVPNGAYTPQLVVNGQLEMNATDGRRVLGTIAEAQGRPAAAAVAIETRLEAGDHPVLSVDAAAEMLQGVDASRLELRVALFENGLVTQVKGGENGGKTLSTDFVVRRLQTACFLPGDKGARRQGRVKFELDRSWRMANLGVAAFLQDPASMRILGARATALPAAAAAAPQASARSSVTTSTSPPQP